MARVERDCERYYKGDVLQLVKDMWANWYTHLCDRVMRLGSVRVLQSRFRLVGDGPKLQLVVSRKNQRLTPGVCSLATLSARSQHPSLLNSAHRLHLASGDSLESLVCSAHFL